MSKSNLMNTVSVKENLRIIGAKGSYLFTDKNTKLLDWFADVGTVNLGYSPP